MKYRTFGKTGWKVSEISFGAWAIGADWGSLSDEESMKALHRALDEGINLFDTADVYGDGRSERLLAKLKKERDEDFHIITKAGRRLDPHTASGYTRENLNKFVDRSLKNLGAETLDLLQLHCPPTEVYYMHEVFGALDEMAKKGKIRHYGVSVEKVEEAIKAIEYPNVISVQIIFNMFRQRPKDLFFRLAEEKDIAILTRVPLASGLLTGKFSEDTTFPKDDHRQYNRQGESFDRGETFAGVDFETGLEAVDQVEALMPEGWTMAQFALRWILMHDAVSCAIPGAKKPSQVKDNASASELPPIPDEKMKAIEEIYEKRIKPLVHHFW